MNGIKNIMQTDFPKIEGDKPISKAASMMKDVEGIILLVDGKYDGVVNKRDLAKTKIPPNTKARTFLSHVAKVSVDESLEKTAALMLESDSYLLPVFDKKKLTGVVTARDILKQAAETEFGEKSIDAFISQPVIKIEADEPVAKAINMFNKRDISRLPVFEDNHLSGIITIDDVFPIFIQSEHRQGGAGQYEDTSKFGAYMADKKEYLDLPVKGLMTAVVSTVQPDESIRNVVDTMFKREYRGVLIGNEKSLDGIVTKKDLLEPLATTMVREPLVVQFSGKLDRIKDFEKQWPRDVIHSNFEKYLDYLDNALITVRLKQHDEQSKGKHIIFCNMRLSSPRGMFVAKDEGWGYMDAINKCSEAIERQIEKKKER